MITMLIIYSEELGVEKQTSCMCWKMTVLEGNFANYIQKFFDHILWPNNYCLKGIIKQVFACGCVSVHQLNDWKYLVGVVCKHQKSISHSAGGWEVHDQGISRFGVWWELSSCFIGDCLLAKSLHSRRGTELSEVPFINTIILFTRVQPS